MRGNCCDYALVLQAAGYQASVSDLIQFPWQGSWSTYTQKLLVLPTTQGNGSAAGMTSERTMAKRGTITVCWRVDLGHLP